MSPGSIPRLIAAGLMLLTASAARAESRFGIRFVADAGMDEAATVARLDGFVRTLNRYYQNSQVALRAEIGEVAFAPIGEGEAVAILDAMRGERNGFEGLLAAAARVGAHYSVALTPRLRLHGKPGCGRALAVNRTPEALASPREGLMVMNPACGAHTLAHELGHLMGLNHGHLVDSCQPRSGHASAMAPHALGFGAGNCDGKPQPGEFGDIMVGGWMGRIHGNDKASLPFFSNPRLHDPRCGVTGVCGDAQTGDAARFLNENAHHYANKGDAQGDDTR